MSGFTKLWSDIVDSSIWNEDADTCKVWVTLLALSNEVGFVRGSIRWLAAKAKVSVDKCQIAVDKFLAPDPGSRTETNEGRRIQIVDRGWIILNYEYFRNDHCHVSPDHRKVYQRDWVRKKRAMNHLSTTVDNLSTSTKSIDTASASASVQKGESERETRFKDPTLEEVKLVFAKSGGSESEAVKFFNWYSSNGWKVGKNKMKSMPHSAAGWISRCREPQHQPPKPPSLMGKDIAERRQRDLLNTDINLPD